MKNLTIGLVAASVMLAGPALAQSAKFAATYDDSRFSVVSVIDSDTQPNDCNVNDGYTFATIKVPQDKELLVGVSSEVLLVTDTSIKGKDGGTARALAYASAEVTVGACPVDGGDCQIAAPGSVVLADRFQILEGTLGGVLTNCTDSNGDGDIDLSDCELTDEEISLVIDTLSSHHFNFVLEDMDQGDYNIVALFGTAACNEISSDGDAEAFAFAMAAIGKSMVTVQQVRATKDGIIDANIID
jgi:hypothetical protein